MRVFVSVPVPDDLLAKVSALGKELAQDGVSLVRPENMHLTLRFLGEMDEKRVGDVEQRLRAVRFGAFRCGLKGVGVFPDENYVKVVWAGCESGGKLEALAKDVMGALSGFGGDERFTAHLTIARVKKKIDAKPFLARHKDDGFGSFEVKNFHLMQSVLKPTGPEYSVLASFEAEGK
ncbi:MAG: RNA 2',3'-cyclic phosphodiesterase [Candidatus Micrarchaeota archaeon]